MRPLRNPLSQLPLLLLSDRWHHLRFGFRWDSLHRPFVRNHRRLVQELWAGREIARDRPTQEGLATLETRLFYREPYGDPFERR
jgi:hypothetical protein